MGLFDKIRSALEERRRVKGELERVREQERKEAVRRAQERQMHLERAAGVSRVVLVCHADTLTFLERKMTDLNGYPLFQWRSPSEDEVKQEGDGIVQVRLSGPQVVSVLQRMYYLAHDAPVISSADVAIAKRLYLAVVAVIDQVDPTTTGKPVPPIVIDAGIPDD